MKTTASSLISTQRPVPATSPWGFFFLDHLDEFARLTWYLVADPLLVERVIMRTLMRLEGTAFEAAEVSVLQNLVRDVLVAESIVALDIPEGGFIEGRPESSSRIAFCDFPNLPRIASIVKLALTLPQSDIADALSLSPKEADGLLDFAILYLNHSLPNPERTTVYQA